MVASSSMKPTSTTYRGRDTRHNFSVYFYLLYLLADSPLSLPVGILAFLPQAVLLLTAAVTLYRDVTFCVFVQTVTFVTFNKVCHVPRSVSGPDNDVCTQLLLCPLYYVLHYTLSLFVCSTSSGISAYSLSLYPSQSWDLGMPSSWQHSGSLDRYVCITISMCTCILLWNFTSKL